MAKSSKIIFRTIALFVGVLCVLAFFWVRAHATGSMPPSPWPPRIDVVPPSENGYVLARTRADTLRAFDELLLAPIEEHARIFRENEISIDRAVRVTAETRAQVDAMPRFVLGGEDVIEALNFVRHRTVAVLVEADAPDAIAMARVFWRHALDAITQCETLIECMLGLAISDHAMLAVESVLYRFDADEVPERSDLIAEVQRAFDSRPSLARAVESEYLFARSAIEQTACVSLDRSQTEAIMREYYEAMHNYAEGVANVDDIASDEGVTLARRVEPFRGGLQDEFSSFYNICGGTLAETFWLGLANRIEDHRERVEELIERQQALH